MTYRKNFTIQMAAILIMNSSVSSLIHMQIAKTINCLISFLIIYKTPHFDFVNHKTHLESGISP